MFTCRQVSGLSAVWFCVSGTLRDGPCGSSSGAAPNKPWRLLMLPRAVRSPEHREKHHHSCLFIWKTLAKANYNKTISTWPNIVQTNFSWVRQWDLLNYVTQSQKWNFQASCRHTGHRYDWKPCVSTFALSTVIAVAKLYLRKKTLKSGSLSPLLSSNSQCGWVCWVGGDVTAG